jgi:hypothetical protein
MSKSFKALGLAVSALALTHLPAAAQTKVTNGGSRRRDRHRVTGICPAIKFWGVPVSNGMKRSGKSTPPEASRAQDQAGPRG